MTMQRSFLALALAIGLAAPALAADEHAPQPTKQKWSFAGPFGKYDRAQLQRGFKVYREVCQSCHSLSLVAFRTLADPGGPGFTTAQATRGRRRIQGAGRAERCRRNVRASRRAGRPFPEAVCERQCRARGQWRRACRPICR